jgi:small-conductance mechanosensitive channel
VAVGDSATPVAQAGLLQDAADWLAGHQTSARLIASALTVLVAWTIVKATERALVRSTKRLGKRRGWDDYQVRGAVGRTKPMRMTVKIAMFVLAIIALMGVWGLQTAFTGLLAGAGFAGLVIGLAAGDAIRDLIAGFRIFYNHPFDLGDWVEVDNVQGTVDDVRLGATTILTFDNEKVTIPNRLVEGQKIRNFSHARKLRFKMPVGVEYGTNLEHARNVMEKCGIEQGQVMDEPAPLAVVTGFGESRVNMELRVWLEPVRSSVLRVRAELLEMLHDRLHAEGIRIAYPHMQIVQSESWQISHADGDHRSAAPPESDAHAMPTLEGALDEDGNP